MKKNEKSIATVEDFVARVLASSFNQKLDKDTLRAVAEKVARAVKVDPHKEPA